MVPGPTVDLAGTAVHLEAEGNDLEHLRWFFGHHPAADSDEQGQTTHLHCTVGATRLDVPSRQPDSVNGPIARWTFEGGAILRHESGRAAGVTPATITLDPAPSEAPAWLACRQLLAEAMSCWFARRGGAVLHAGLVGRDGTAALIIGPTGAGKSTMVASALAVGLQVYADDLVVITAKNHAAHGIPKRIMIEHSQAHQLGLPWSETPGERRGRVMLGPDTCATGPTRIVGVILPTHSPGPATVTSMPHSSTLAAIVASSFEAAHGRVTAVFPALAHLAGLPGHRVELDVDPAHRLERAGRVLESLLTSATQ